MARPEYTPDQINARIKADPEMVQLYKDDPTEFEVKASAIYHRFGYRPDGTPMSVAQKAIGIASRATGIPEEVTHAVAAAPLPMLGTVLGIAAGAGGGVPGMAIGAAGGSILGEAANSLLGISDPMSNVDIGIAAGAPLVGQVVAKSVPGALKIAKRIVPGVGAGLNEQAAEVLERQAKGLRVTKDDVDAARSILSNARDFKIDIPLTRDLFQRESGDIAKQAAQGVPDTSGYLNELNAQIVNLGKSGPKSFKELMALEQGFNRIKSGRPNEVWAAASGKIIDDMELYLKKPGLSTATKEKVQEGLTAFKTFIQTNRKFQADEELVNLFKVDGKVVKTVAGQPDLVLFDRNAFKKQISNNETLKKAFSPEELNSMVDAVKDLGYIGKPPSGSSNIFSLAKRWGVGGAVGGILGGMPGAAVGMATEEAITQAVTTPTGRSIVKYLSKQGRGTIHMMELSSMLGKALAVTGAGEAGRQQPAGQNLPDFSNRVLPTNQE